MRPCYKVRMGLVKRMLEEIWERGWESIGKSICPDCLENPALKELAEENLDADECDYCGQSLPWRLSGSAAAST